MNAWIPAIKAKGWMASSQERIAGRPMCGWNRASSSETRHASCTIGRPTRYVQSKQTVAASFAEKTASRVPRVFLAGRTCPGAWVSSRSGIDRTFLSVGFLSWREISHHSILAGLGKVACEERGLHPVHPYPAHPAREPNVSFQQPDRHRLSLHTTGREPAPSSGRRNAQTSEPLNRWRSHPSIHELLAMERAIHHRPTSLS